MGRKGTFNLKEIVLKMTVNSREFLLHSVFEQFSHTFKLWEVVCIHKTIILLLHKLVQAPKDFFLVIRDIEKKQANDEIHSLNIAHFIIVVRICL